MKLDLGIIGDMHESPFFLSTGIAGIGATSGGVTRSYRRLRHGCRSKPFHELVHSTPHPERLARDLGKRFGDQADAAEELIAEIGAAFLCADLGITLEPRDDHAAYIATWLNVLRSDARAIFAAAAQAHRAAEYLHALAAAHR